MNGPVLRGIPEKVGGTLGSRAPARSSHPTSIEYNSCSTAFAVPHSTA
jgi:hypothetical protein